MKIRFFYKPTGETVDDENLYFVGADGHVYEFYCKAPCPTFNICWEIVRDEKQMKKEKFNKLALHAGFGIATCMDGKQRIASPSDYDVVDSELQLFKDLLLDEVVKEVQTLSPRPDGAVSELVGIVVSKIEAMK